MKAVLFDIGGVVVECDLERYLHRAVGVFACEQPLKAELARGVRDLETGKLTSFEFWDRVGQRLMLSGEGRRGRPRHFRNLFRNPMLDSLKLNRPLLWLCQMMARNGITVGAVSNTIEDHARILTEHGAYAPFHPCILSCRVGHRKPDPEMYRLAAREAGASPYQCLMVDDNGDNLPSASRLGMSTHHYKDVRALATALANHRALSFSQLRLFRRTLAGG
ncbi:MAG: HAD family phosphatase [Candidatus Eremiobacterota bacterium]